MPKQQPHVAPRVVAGPGPRYRVTVQEHGHILTTTQLTRQQADVLVAVIRRQAAVEGAIGVQCVITPETESAGGATWGRGEAASDDDDPLGFWRGLGYAALLESVAVGVVLGVGYWLGILPAW